MSKNIKSDETQYLLNLINRNSYIKKEELETINQFEEFYSLIKKYHPLNYSFNKVISDSDTRLKFFNSATNTIIKTYNIDEETLRFATRMLDTFWSYFYGQSRLEDLEIPKQIKDKMFINNNETKRELLIPDYNNIEFLLTLITENKKIYEDEFEGVDLSQTINNGLHTNIKEVLSIDKKDLSHLLGTNNDAYSLYEFYRKNYLNNEILKIQNRLRIRNLKSMDSHQAIIFNQEFQNKFGLPYNIENYHFLISLRYNEIDEMLKEGKITSSQADKLKLSYDEAPKSKTIDFYTDENTITLLSQECLDNANFTYDYVRKNIITSIINNSTSKKELLEKLAEERLNKLEEIKNNQLEKFKHIPDELEKKQKITKLNNQVSEAKKIILNYYESSYIDKIMNYTIDSNSPEIRQLIDQYFEIYGNKLKDNYQFQRGFKEKFGYNYPLIDYYEILTKNISFYNFTLMKNLNSIIVDFTGKKNPNDSTDVYLVSYSKPKRIENELAASSSISDSDEELLSQISEDTKTNDEYLNSLKSLHKFPKKDRYYFHFGFLSHLKRKKDDSIIKTTTSPNDIFSLIGFSTTKEEQERLSSIKTEPFRLIEHKHNFRTNITTNFYEYATYYTRYGVECPITSVFSKKNGKTRLLTVSKNNYETIEQCISILNNKLLNNDLSFDKEYDIYLIKRVISDIKNYEKSLKIKIKYLNYQKEHQLPYNNDYNYEDKIINEEIKLEELKLYFEILKNEIENIFSSQNPRKYTKKKK